MSFEIRFKLPTEPHVFPDSNSPSTEGQLEISGMQQSFLASHGLWSRAAYEDDWARNQRRLSLGLDCVFVVDINPRVDGGFSSVWPVLQTEGTMWATEVLLSGEIHGSRFLYETIAELVDFDELRQALGTEVSFFEVTR